MSLISTQEIKKRKERALLETGRYIPPRSGSSYNILTNHTTYPSIDIIFTSALKSKYLVVDLETKGTDYSQSAPDVEVIGVGLAWDSGSIYFDINTTPLYIQKKLITLLSTHQALVAHNVYFDGGFLFRDIGHHLNWKFCTYSLLSLLANEGYKDDRWGLKEAMTEFLGWQETNETELDLWLCLNGYYKGVKRTATDPEELKQSYLEGVLRPKKEEMWRAPRDTLGKYCILDCEATYLLLTEVLLPVYSQFPSLIEYYEKDFLPGILLHINQKIQGIVLDIPATEKLHRELGLKCLGLENQIRQLPECRKGIDLIEARLKQEHIDTEPVRYLKEKKLKVPIQKYKKNGELTKAWLAYEEKSKAPRARLQSKLWLKWSEKLDQIEAREDEAYKFNINSDDQLRELIYDHLGNEAVIFTPSGLPSTSSLALAKFSEVGSLLESYFTLSKRRGFTEKYLELSRRDGLLRPNFRMPGTCTGRASSSQINFQQVPKIDSILSLFKASEGYQFVDLDFSSLEPVVVAEFSGDRNMRFLYEDPNQINDPYLFLGAQVAGSIGEQIRSTGYDPFNPSSSTISKAKKEVKGIRQICKAVFLGASYGAGLRKLHKILEEQGIYLSLDEVEGIHKTYWDAFQGVKKFETTLRREYLRKGYIMNGLGRPMAICEDFNKDLLNRFIQSTGHDILLKYIRILTDKLTMEGIDWNPILLDLHDATTVEVRNDQVPRAIEIFNEAMDELNLELGGDLKFRGVPTWGATLSDVKEPEL